MVTGGWVTLCGSVLHFDQKETSCWLFPNEDMTSFFFKKDSLIKDSFVAALHIYAAFVAERPHGLCQQDAGQLDRDECRHTIAR